MNLIKLKCRSAGMIWPEILYTVQRHIADVLELLDAKILLPEEGHPIETRCGGSMINLFNCNTGEKYLLYLGMPQTFEDEVCIVQNDDDFYYTDKELYGFLFAIFSRK